jgi:hypothetical protein
MLFCASLFLILCFGIYRMVTHTKERAAKEASARAAQAKGSWSSTKVFVVLFVFALIWTFAYARGWVSEKPPFLRDHNQQLIDER